VKSLPAVFLNILYNCKYLCKNYQSICRIHGQCWVLYLCWNKYSDQELSK